MFCTLFITVFPLVDRNKVWPGGEHRYTNLTPILPPHPKPIPYPKHFPPNPTLPNYITLFMYLDQLYV